jgi:hypothetical protein
MELNDQPKGHEFASCVGLLVARLKPSLTTVIDFRLLLALSFRLVRPSNATGSLAIGMGMGKLSPRIVEATLVAAVIVCHEDGTTVTTPRRKSPNTL